MSSGRSPSNIDRVLVTGATSYLGRALIGRLFELGAQVHVIGRPGSNRSRLEGLSGTATFHEHDGSTENMLDIVSAGAPETVFHLATKYLRVHTPEQVSGLVTNNILFGTQLLEAMRVVGVTRLINLGTYFQFYDSTDYRPVNLYAAAKQAFDCMLTYYRDAHGIQAATLVTYDVYGPGDWRSKLMAAIRDAQENGTALALPASDVTIDLVYVDDMVDALVYAANVGIDGGPYGVSGGDRHTLDGVIGVFENVGGRPIKRDWGVLPTPERTPAKPWVGPPMPGWRAKVSLREGVRCFLEGKG